jgi:hypothetical protein
MRASYAAVDSRSQSRAVQSSLRPVRWRKHGDAEGAVLPSGVSSESKVLERELDCVPLSLLERLLPCPNLSDAGATRVHQNSLDTA